nr:radical SAM protein [uncultured Acetatifactor sp.]
MTQVEMYEYFQRKAMESHSLFQIEIDVTSKCNANCPFCFQGDHNHAARDEMSLQMITNLLDDLREMGTYYIGFSGGEPFARDDFPDILEAAKKRGFRVSLITNAMLLSEEKIDRLSELGIERVTVSFHSIHQNTYGKSFGINSSNQYFVALDNIHHMLKRNISLGLAITVTKDTIQDLEDTTKHFLDLGLREQDINYNLLLRGQREIEELMPKESDIVNNGKYLSNKINSSNSDIALLCAAGTYSCSIDAFGNVYPCTFFNSIAGNLYNQSISEIWETSHLFKIIRSFREEMFQKCASCSNKGKCHLCIATNLNETNNIFEPSSSFCESRKARFKMYA